jgi:DNA-binding HxlR family transcriptional regulator
MVPSSPSDGAIPGSARPGAPSVASMVESIVGCKWSVRLLELIASECRRPSAILRSCPGLSAKVMNERLRKMRRFAIVQRTVLGEKPPVQVEYALTGFGRRFIRILEEVHKLQEAVDHEEIAMPDRGSSRGIRPHRPATARRRRPPRKRG